MKRNWQNRGWEWCRSRGQFVFTPTTSRDAGCGAKVPRKAGRIVLARREGEKGGGVREGGGREKRFKSKIKGSLIFVCAFSKIRMKRHVFCFFLWFSVFSWAVFLFFIVLFQHLMIQVKDLEMCAFILAGAFSNSKQNGCIHPQIGSVRCGAAHWRAARGDAAALKARPLRRPAHCDVDKTQTRGGSRRVLRSPTVCSRGIRASPRSAVAVLASPEKELRNFLLNLGPKSPCPIFAFLLVSLDFQWCMPVEVSFGKNTTAERALVGNALGLHACQTFFDERTQPLINGSWTCQSAESRSKQNCNNSVASFLYLVSVVNGLSNVFSLAFFFLLIRLRAERAIRSQLNKTDKHECMQSR